MVVTNQQAALRPRIVGRYALFDEIAAGGMATIHLGRLVGPVGFSRTVAIKTLHPQFAKDPEFVEMFLEEARLASRIRHPNVISTVDVATAEGEVFLVMEYVAGESLAKLVRSALKRGAQMPVDVAASVLAGMLHGLHATHEAKNEQLEPMHIVHRDVSPQNVLVGLDGVARIFDFGVAKAAAMRSQATSDGQMKGKLSYMSPEQLNSREVDRRTDVFAAGVVAWECLVGRRLFAGSDPGEVLAKVLTLDIPAPIQVQSSIPQSISNTVMRALERSPEQRWQTARDFAIELERNIPLAASHVVGDWVAQNAGEALLDRRHRVEAVERASVDLGHVNVNGAEIASPPSSRSLNRDSIPYAVDAADVGNASSSTSRASNLTVSSSAAATQHTMARQLGMAALVGILGAAILGGVWFWQQRAGNPISTPSSASVAVSPGEAIPTVEPPSGGAAEESGVAAPPVLEIDSLPVHQAVPDAGTSPGRPTASTDRSIPVPPRVRRAGRRPPPRPAPPPVEVTAPTKDKPAAAATVEDKNPASAKPECAPPWYIDAKGIQRVKPMCL